jgi:hypothetical protein
MIGSLLALNFLRTSHAVVEKAQDWSGDVLRAAVNAALEELWSHRAVCEKCNEICRDSRGNPSEAVLEIRYRRIRVLPPIGKSKQYPALTLTVIHARERGVPTGRDQIDWKLITDLPVTSRKQAIEKLKWYSLRWRIEVFHKAVFIV